MVPFWKRAKTERVDLDVKGIGASRAIYVNEDIQRVEVKVETTDDYSIILTLTPKQTAELIEQMTMAYYAINPQLRTRRETYGN